MAPKTAYRKAPFPPAPPAPPLPPTTFWNPFGLPPSPPDAPIRQTGVEFGDHQVAAGAAGAALPPMPPG